MANLPEIRIVSVPMRDAPPESDVFIAHRLAKIQDDLMTLGDTPGWQADTVRAKLKLRAKKILDEHDAHQRAFDNWLAEGRPDLDKSAGHW